MSATAALDARLGHFARLVGEVPIPAHGGPMPAPSPADLALLKSSAWRALRRFNELRTSDAKSDMDDAARAVEAAEEEYRLAHHPSALKVFVLADDDRGQACQVYAVYPTGPVLVHEAAPAGAAS